MSDTVITGGQQPPAGATTWVDTLPQELRGNPSLAQFQGKTWEEVGPTIAKSYVETKSMIGADKMLKPSEKWGEKEYNDFYAQLGRPEAPDKYSMPEVQMPEGLKLDDAKIAERKALYHKAGLSDRQAKALIEADLTFVKSSYEADQQSTQSAKTSAESSLKQEWGDKYQANIELARSVVAKFGDDQFTRYIEESGLGNDPRLIKMLAKAGQGLMEDRATGKGTTEIAASAGAAMDEINQLKGDKEFMDKYVKGDKYAVERFHYLQKVAYPSNSNRA
jgi:hypothetical protein